MSENTPNPFDHNQNKRNNEEQPPEGGGISAFWLLIILLILTALGVYFLADRFPGALSDDDDQIHLVRLLAILLLVMSSAFGIRRINKSTLPRHLRDIGIWVAIFAVMFIGYSYRDVFEDLRQRVSSNLLPTQATTSPTGAIVFSRSNDGHFYVEALADNQRIKFLVDTGASSIVLSPGDAKRLGFDFNKLSFTQIFETANGTGRGAKSQLYSLVVGEREFRDIRVSINQAPMSTSLLGMSFLEQFKSFEFNGDRLILRSQ
ncbi:retropepsin-like aspartic protease family protein [Kiloniella sp.]|uniref:retropepsin-like aspartic protease family protein n=1 Tax=Kiloniella sp. TaxID=1938587 RepID=UPI003B02AEFB